jgi:hypothetical protein
MPWGRRLLLSLIGVFPLLAPWELLVSARWSDHLNPLFLLSVAISAGAIALSALLFFAALAGLSSRMVLDATRSTFTYSAIAPIVSRRVRVYPFAALERVDVSTHEWSDGAPTYSLRIVTGDGVAHESASSWSRDEIEGYRDSVNAFLARHGSVRPKS